MEPPKRGHANRPAAGKAASEFSVKEAGICLPDPPSIAPEKVRSPSCPDNLPEAAGSCKLCGESPFALGFFHKRKKIRFFSAKGFHRCFTKTQSLSKIYRSPISRGNAAE